MKGIKIGNKIIEESSPCFIVAEIGMNHNGNINLAKEIIKSAASCGVDAVKFQIFTAEKLVTKDAKTYGNEDGHLPDYQQEMYKKYELTEEQYKELKKYCDELGVIFFASVFDEENADMLERVGTEAYKIASCDITHIPMLKHIAKKDKPVIISTGMSTMEEVKEAIKAILSGGNDKIILTHCISSYPAEVDKSNLKTISFLKKKFKFPIGYSDHTPGWLSSIAAVAMGAKVIEKHFTTDKKLPGVDHHLSADVEDMKNMVKNIRLIEKGFGKEEKIVTEAELETRKMARRSLVAKINITKGSKITKDMIIIKRPGCGIAPKDLYKVVGKIAGCDIKEDTILRKDMLK